MGERRRENEKERERRGSETDVPKLYPTMNMNSLCLVFKSEQNLSNAMISKSGKINRSHVIMDLARTHWYSKCL